jgi:hypothetical protein
MPVHKGAGFSDMAVIAKFIREAQQQNGIVYREYKM